MELYLKLEKIDPSLIADSSLRFKEENFKRLATELTDLDAKGKQFIANANAVGT